MTNIAIGDVTNSTVVVGNDNFVVHLDKVEQGATVNIVKPDSGPKYWPQPQPVVKLPRPFPALPGRDKELAVLQRAAQASANVSLWARQGMGKTAIARHLTNSLNQQDASQSVVYLDALGLGREDLLQALFDTFFNSAPSYVPAPASIPNALQKVKALVFVDNLAFSGDEIDSLLNAAPNCAFVLISTERTLWGEGEVLALGGLPDADALGLFEGQFGRPLDDLEKEACLKICALLKGSPDEIIRIAGRGREAQKTPAQLLTELNDSGTDDKALATLATAGLNDTDRKVLAFLAAAGENAVPLDLLKSTFKDMDVSAELERLKGLDLVQSHSPRFSLCGNLASGLEAAWDLSASRDALLHESTDWLSRQQASDPVQESLGLLLQALADAAERKKWPEVIRLGRLLEGFLIRFKRLQAWSDVLHLVLQAAQALLDRTVEGWALHQLGSRALLQGAFDEARTYLTRALDIRKELNDLTGASVTRHNLDVLKGFAPPQRGNGSGKGGPSGGHPFTYGFFGFAGIVLIAVAAYVLTHPAPVAPATKPVAPPIIDTTSAPITPSFTPSPTPSPTLTLTPTETATSTATFTPSPTATPPVGTPFPATVAADFLACRYGPGSPYLFEWTLSKGDQVLVLGRADTAFGPWVRVKFAPRSKIVPQPCWVNPRFLDYSGDISTLDQLYPDKAPLILFKDPRFPAPADVSADRTGNQVSVTWSGYVLALGDRESATSPRFLLEFWTCIGGQIVFTPMGVGQDLQAKPFGFATLGAQVQDDAGCSQPSHGQVYLAHKDGYVGPVAIIPWPPQ